MTEPVLMGDRLAQLDALFWELTKQLDLNEYKLMWEAVSMSQLAFKDDPRFNYVRELAQERDRLSNQRTEAHKELRKLQNYAVVTNNDPDVH